MTRGKNERMSETKKPTRYEVVTKDGKVLATFDHQRDAYEWAIRNLPGEQETGDGPDPTSWDIQVVGADR